MTRRRAWVVAGASTLASALALAGCGFELQRPPALRFRTIRLTGFPVRSPLAAALQRSIAESDTTRVVEAEKDADVVLRALADERDKRVVAITAASLIREFELRSRFVFELRTPAGKELIAPSEIILRRNLSYSESAALAKEQEEASLYRAMQGDIVSQVLRRLASVDRV